MNYSKINNLAGWITFLIASITYILTLEPSASFWDCGEFIAAAYKLQVVHQPGAPLFLMVQKSHDFHLSHVHTKIHTHTHTHTYSTSADPLHPLRQRCPTHSPLATCGEWPFKCGE